MFRLTSDMIFDLPTYLQTFQIQPEKKTEVQNLLKHQFPHRTINHKKIEMYP